MAQSWWILTPVAYSLWEGMNSPAVILLTVIAFLLWRQWVKKRDFYAVDHVAYDLEYELTLPGHFGIKRRLEPVTAVWTLDGGHDWREQPPDDGAAHRWQAG